MTLRNRFLITAAWLCHLLLAPTLVTSQLPSSSVPALRQKTESGQPASNSACPTQADPHAEYPTVVCAITQEKNGAIYKLHGAAEIHYETYILRADEATYNSDTGETTADGHFALDGGPNDDHIRASHGAYNFTLETGRFFDVTGTTGLRFRGTRVILTSTAPFAFTGKVVEKTSPDHYMVYDGTVTSCEMPHPKWLFNARKVVIDVGGNAKIYHSTFVLHGLPILYFPFATHPVERDARQSGFLMPSIGRSSVKGNVIGEAYYWAIDRQMDATVGAEYFSLRGWSQRGEFRARPSETSFVDLNYFGVIDRGIGYPPLKEGGENARLNAVGMVGDGFRGVANIDYLSSFLLRLAFDEVFSQAVYSEVKSQAFLSKSDDGFNLNGFAERYQNFGLNSTTSAQGITTTTAQQVIAISHVPSLDFSSVDHRLSRSPFYWSFDASAAGLTRSEASEPGEPGFSTDNLLGRFDLAPEISLPLLFGGWSIRPELSLHETYYTERPSPSGAILAVSDPVNRQAMEMSVEMRPPALERVFDKEFLGRKWKHVVEPQAVYRFVTGVNNFANIPKFDERDILTDTHEVEYGFITRLYAKRTAAKTEDCGAAMPNLMVGGSASESTVPWQHTSTLANSQCRPAPQVSEIVTWELAQKYFLDPTFGGALVAGERNVFTSTVDLTGIAFATQPRHLSPLVSRLRVETSSHTDTEWDLDYDFQQGRANASTLLANYHIGPVTISGGDAILFSLPTPSTASLRFNQFRAALGYGRSSRRGFSGASSFGFDSVSGLLQFASAQTTYNWDCCGMTMEYRRYDIANVRNENLFRFNFTLANIGSFGDLRKQERLY